MRTTQDWRRIALPAVLALGLAGTGSAAPRKSVPVRRTVTTQANANARVIPMDTVVKLELDDKLSSRDAARGDRFTATLADDDHSGFPEGTTFEGIVTEVRRSTKSQPGILDMKIQRAVLPGGRAVGVNGTLASLEDDDVRRSTNGRLEARRSGGKNKFDAKWVGYGAAGGAVLSTVFGGKLGKGAIMGALGGAAYAYLNKGKGKNSYSEVELSRGTDFGIRMHNRVAFQDSSSFRYATYDPDRDR